MPFAVAVADGVLTLTLDTPRSPINVFDHATAAQLRDVMAGVDAATTRAIVFETAKPASFINGVGLLLAQSARSDEDVVRASTPPWEAYRAVREAPVPTIAVVQGSCFGCGVEFVLNCDYRIATDSCATRFYMTELNDYLFVPLFGSTWNLPAAVGLADAIDLLLWGARWDAATARARGLVDEVVAYDALAARRAELVQRVLDGRLPSRRRGRVAWSDDEEAVLVRARRRVAALPPQYHEVYGDALRLLEAGARQRGTYVEHQRQELRCSAASALAPIGKAAYGFFYIRQMASERAAGRVRSPDAPVGFAAAPMEDDEARAFVDDLRRRKLPGVGFVDDAAADHRFVSAGTARDGREVGVTTGLGWASPRGFELCAPTYRLGGRLVELACGPDVAPDAAARLAGVLQRLGFEVARTPTFVSERLVRAYLSPLVRFVEDGGDVAATNGALRAAGFVRLPYQILAGLEVIGASALDADECAHGEEPALLDALALSLLDAVLAARRDGVETVVVDLVARELLDFPRHLTSLGRWLRTERVARALANDAARALVPGSACASAERFVAAGRELYR